MKKRVKMVCESCGSDDVCIDAAARWNVRKQQWEVTSEFIEHATCDYCMNDDAQVVEKEIRSKK